MNINKVLVLFFFSIVITQMPLAFADHDHDAAEEALQAAEVAALEASAERQALILDNTVVANVNTVLEGLVDQHTELLTAQVTDANTKTSTGESPLGSTQPRSPDAILDQALSV